MGCLAIVLALLAGCFAAPMVSMMTVMASFNNSQPSNVLPAACEAATLDGQAAVNGQPRWPGDKSVGQPDSDQLAIAAAIVTAGDDLKVPDYGQVVALTTAAQESGWRNVDHGDAAGPDSRGVFQLRAPWGPESVRMDPHSAAALFYRALLKVPGWESLPIGQAAQQVQRSADASGDWYARHEPIARAAFAFITGSQAQAQCGSNGHAMACPPTGSPAENGLTPDALRVIRCLKATFPELKSFGGVGDRPANVDDDHQAGRAVDAMVPDWSHSKGKALGDRMAAWAQKNQKMLGIKYVIWHTKIWSVQRTKEGWRDYTNPSGTNPTLAHLNHVHVSVYGDAAGQTAAGSGSYVLPVKNYTLTARFGQSGDRWHHLHTGLDFATSTGKPILAVTGGKVLKAGWGGPYGNWTCIDIGAKTQNCYAHQSAIAVKVGQQVKTGQRIGSSGETGNVTGPHVHLEVRVAGVAIDPFPWLRERGLRP